jgi:polar amino acid transport system substrate-binding protein
MLCFPPFFCLDSYAQNIRFVGETTIPLLFENSQKEKYGALLELVNVLSAYTKLESTVELMPWARAYETALREPNVVLIAALKTPQRISELQWIGKVLHAQAHLIALKDRSDITITNIQQAKKYIVASVRGYGSAAYLLGQGFNEKHNLVLTSHQSQMWGVLYNRRVDLVLANLKIGRFEAKHIGLDSKRMRSKLKITELTHDLEFATGLSTPAATVLQLKNGLDALKKNGTYNAILNKWNLD